MTEVTDRTAVNHDTMVERGIDLSFDFAQMVLEDPTILDQIPNGIALVLIPDDDPDLAAAKVELGVAAVRRGEDVYFRHMRRQSDSSANDS